MKRKRGNAAIRFLSMLLAAVLLFTEISVPVQAAEFDGEPVGFEENLIMGTGEAVSDWGIELHTSEDEETQTMEIKDFHLENFTSYDTYYYTDGITYTYKGNEVTFISDTEIQAGGKVYALKNKKTDITVTADENGDVTVSLSDLTIPVAAIQGEWNSGVGGKREVVYQTDIPGMEEVRSGKINAPLTLSGLENGVYHLTYGVIYEAANSSSVLTY